MKKLSKEAEKLKRSILKEYDISDEAGIAILETGMEAFDTMHKSQAVVDKDGLTVRGDRGQVRAHPLLSVIRDARAQFLMALKHLNLDLLPLESRPGRPSGR
jgi:P27 family predicted phage terminase small subunit